MDNFTSIQREYFYKISNCAEKFRSGSESALEYSILLFHQNNGLRLHGPEEDDARIIKYVIENY
jgi:hypothetical protein